MNFWKLVMGKRDRERGGRELVPSTELADKEQESRTSEEHDEDESLLYSSGGRFEEGRKNLSRKIWTAVLVVGSMVCCFAGGFMARDLTLPLVWNFDRYETREQQES